ncbi:MAG TPA: hypothetical protein VFT12_05935 [Thermoanaerobaculia bacterium]|nr:hypothetical protein [Thermoanaerobaculia bacterium]
MSADVLASVIFCCGPLCPEEEITAELERSGIAVIRLASLDDYRHDADLIAARALEAVNALPAGMPVGLVGAGAAAAGVLIAAAENPDAITAVVSINGRTDLASDHLRMVRIPALLIVNDMPVLRMNREAITSLRGERRLEVVHGLGPEESALIVEKTSRWLTERLVGVAAA